MLRKLVDTRTQECPKKLWGFSPEQSVTEHNFRVLQPTPSMADDTIIRRLLLPGRIIVTNNLADFEDDVEAFEYGVIYVTQAAMADPANVAHRISQAYSKLSLKRSAPCILTIGVESTTLKRFD